MLLVGGSKYWTFAPICPALNQSGASTALGRGRARNKARDFDHLLDVALVVERKRARQAVANASAKSREESMPHRGRLFLWRNVKRSRNMGFCGPAHTPFRPLRLEQFESRDLLTTV